VVFLRRAKVGFTLWRSHDPQVSVASRTDVSERTIPFTYDRAVTELFMCRRRLVSARSSLELVLAIVARLEPEPDLPAEELGELLGHLEEAESALRQMMAVASARA
jgi:hypothetical protein